MGIFHDPEARCNFCRDPGTLRQMHILQDQYKELHHQNLHRSATVSDLVSKYD